MKNFNVSGALAGGSSASRFATARAMAFTYAHFSPGPYINIRDAQCNEMICRVGGGACQPLDDRISKLT